ncbi:uncharacterized protein ALTATR162_LOCUS2279 [Alternaria atra]|uniref:Uncharacterized protein n=1 Tax=Alternaria atra TaxID=119953 RepID=A0A8J2HXG5_9PLEO|nr:uncharacterized protein ALTATR162_LOCUS2279 [Alternaria atra]CAG5148984.1 unnamed protein product [Alternaria atra]
MGLQNMTILLLAIFVLPIAHATIENPEVPNANHVFNAIHSSMRQWGSSLNHNGMSFFLATVPAGTQLYHGTSKLEAVTGTEWLAFEPEHALIFARPRRGPPPREGHGPPNDQPHHGTDTSDRRSHGESLPTTDDGRKNYSDAERFADTKTLGARPATPPHRQPPPHERPGTPVLTYDVEHYERFDRKPPTHHEERNYPQQPLSSTDSKESTKYGYLHTYTPKHNLRLLYLDGLSAGKTPNGTLDTQDMLLLNLTDSDSPMGGEYKRAEGLCNLTATLWEDKINGVLRMEAGFEIILCDFAKHLKRTDVVAVAPHEHRGAFGRGPDGWQYLKALTSRYQGIGGDRVKLDLENFASVFAYPDIEGLFNNDVQSDYAMPRLQNVKESDRLRVKDDVTAMILRKNWNADEQPRDWQAVADMIVQRYSKPLHHLHTDEEIRGDKDALALYLAIQLRPFISSVRNATLETQRCLSQFIPTLPSPPQPAASLAHLALYAVTHRICDTLLTALSIASSPTSHLSFTSVYASHAVELIDGLVEFLHWTTWKDCGACADEEVCFIPIWPMGSHEDHAHPQCKRREDVEDGGGYWGSRERPHGKRRMNNDGKYEFSRHRRQSKGVEVAN